MIVNFLNCEEFKARYDVTFGYRYTALYEKGFRQRVKANVIAYPLSLKDMCEINSWVESRNLFIVRFVLKIFVKVLFVRQLIIFWDTIILVRLFRKLSVDLIFINNGGYPGSCSCTSAVFAAKIAGIEHIMYVVNNMALSYKSPARWPDYVLDRLVTKHVDFFVTGSLKAARRLSTVLGLMPSQVLNIPNGVIIRPITETEGECRRRLGVDKATIVIGVVALLERRKGHIYLCEAVKVLQQRMRPEELPTVLIEGQGSEFTILKSYINENGLDEQVLFVGNEDNVFNFMNACDIILLPSICNEDFPNVTLEAMGLGKVVIASDIAGIPEQIEHMNQGILVPPANSEKLADAIQLVCSNEGLRAKLGHGALVRFQKEFAANVSVGRYSIFFEKILKGAV